MEFSYSPEQERIREAVAKLCERFPDDYWLKRDSEGGFPADFHQAMAKDGWLGVAMPEEFGGSGLGISEAAVMMQAIAESGAGFSGASAVHMNIFGLNPVVVFGNGEQKRRMLPPLIAGQHKACFAVTEPNTGLNTRALKVKAEKRDGKYFVSGQKVWISTAQVAEKVLLLTQAAAGLTLFYTDFDRQHIEVREIDKMGRHAVDSNQVFFDALPVPEADRIGEEGKGFEYILHGMNPERILIAAELVGLGRCAVARAAKYAKEYQVERYLRESLVGRIAPVSPQLILCFIAERVLGLPKSY